MAKLFKEIFKEDIKTVGLWVVLPIIFFALGGILYKATGIEALGLVITLSIIIMSFGPLISIVALASNDNKRFYGKKASFYSGLPVTSESMTGARTLNYALMGLVIGIIIVLEFLVLVGLTDNVDSMEVVSSIWQVLKNLDGSIILSIIKALVLVFLGFVIFTQTIGLANSLGGSRPLNRLGKYSSALVFVLIHIIQTLVFVRIILPLAIRILKTREVSQTLYGGHISMIEFSLGSYLIVLAFMALVMAAYFALTNYFHKRKLSVQ